LPKLETVNRFESVDLKVESLKSDLEQAPELPQRTEPSSEFESIAIVPDTEARVLAPIARRRLIVGFTGAAMLAAVGVTAAVVAATRGSGPPLAASRDSQIAAVGTGAAAGREAPVRSTQNAPTLTQASPTPTQPSMLPKPAAMPTPPLIPDPPQMSTASPNRPPAATGGAAAMSAPARSPSLTERIANADWDGALHDCAGLVLARLSSTDRMACGIAACNVKDRSLALTYRRAASGASRAAIEHACSEHGIALVAPQIKQAKADPCRDRAYVRENPLKCQ
jgi:hypothetical protein